LPGRPYGSLTCAGNAIMERAARFGYPTKDALAAAAGLSNRTVAALVMGEYGRTNFAEGTFAALEAVLALERGCLRQAWRDDDPGLLRFAAENDAARQARRREVGRLLASAGIARDPARLRSAASRLRAAAPPGDPEMADIAALAELAAAVLAGDDYARDDFSTRLAARGGLTRRDRQAIGARARHAPPPARPAEAEDDSPPAVPRVVFQPAG
jgi:hypothetical protein